jgi:Integrase core domain.
VLYQGKIYVPPVLQKKTLDWYHHNLYDPRGQCLANTIASMCYWKGLTYQVGQVARKYPMCQKCKVNRYAHLPPPKEIDVLTPWSSVHIDLKGPYHITALQNKPGLKTESMDFCLLLMTMVNPVTRWFEVVQVPIFDIVWKDNSLTDTRDKSTLDKSSARISQMFNQAWLSGYSRPNKVIFNNGSEFKKNFFVPLLKDFSIKLTVTTIKNPQSSPVVECIHQVIDSTIKTQQLKDQVLD